MALKTRAESLTIGMLEQIHCVRAGEDEQDVRDRQAEARRSHRQLHRWWPTLQDVLGDPLLRRLRGQPLLDETLLDDLVFSNQLSLEDDALAVLLCGPMLAQQEQTVLIAQLRTVAASYLGALQRVDASLTNPSGADTYLLSHLYATLRFAALRWHLADPAGEGPLSAHEWAALDRQPRTQEAAGKLLVLWPGEQLTTNLSTLDAAATRNLRRRMRESRLTSASDYVARFQWPRSESDQTLWNSPHLKLPLLSALRALAGEGNHISVMGPDLLPPQVRGRALSVAERAALNWNASIRMQQDARLHWLPSGQAPRFPAAPWPDIKQSTLTAGGVVNPHEHDATPQLIALMDLAWLAQQHLFEADMSREDLIRASQGLGACLSGRLQGGRRLIHSLHQQSEFWDGYSLIGEDLELEEECRVTLNRLGLAALRACHPGHPERERHLSEIETAQLILTAYPALRNDKDCAAPTPTEQLRARLRLLATPLGVALHVARLLLAPVKRGEMKYGNQLDAALTCAWSVQTMDEALSALKLSRAPRQNAWSQITETIGYLPRLRWLLCPPCTAEELNAGDFPPDAAQAITQRLSQLQGQGAPA